MYGVPKTTIWRHLQLLNKAAAAEREEIEKLFKPEDDESVETEVKCKLVNEESEIDSNS